MDPSCDQRTNVLLVTLSAQGHINPILRLGKRLVSKGLDVTLAITHYALKTVSSPPNSINNIRLEFFSDGLPIDYNRKANIDHYINTLTECGPVNLIALIRSNMRKFACIINTPFIPWVADVAAEVGVPNAMLWVQPCTLFQIYHRYYNRLDDFPTKTDPKKLVNLPGLPVFTTDDLPSFVLPTNTLHSFDRTLNKVFTNMHNVKWVLGNTFMELENDVITSLNNDGFGYRPVGPLLGDEEDFGFDLFKSKDESTNCIQWLNKQKPSSVVYISFGTIIYTSVEEITSIADGLKTIKRPFLWVIRTQENEKQLELPEDIKQQGLIVNWCPQTAVLSHPSVGCFVSHCGWNSLLESIVAGVPVIACPRWTDQPTNAKLVTDVWEFGVRLKVGEDGGVRGEEVTRCVEEVMGGRRSEEFRRNAAELKTAAREAVRDGGSSDENIRMFVDEVISYRSSCLE